MNRMRAYAISMAVLAVWSGSAAPAEIPPEDAAAVVAEILDVDLERPRNRLELAEDPRYNHCRQEVLRFLYEKQRKADGTAHAPLAAKAPAGAQMPQPARGERAVVTPLHGKHVA
mgnify:CR=1 FL=1